MCLASPGKVKRIEGRRVLIESPEGDRWALNSGETVKIGDEVLVQMGILIKVLSRQEAAVRGFVSDQFRR